VIQDDALCIVMTTVPDIDLADSLAEAAVAARLVACVQRTEITSHYRWEGAVERSGEYLLLMKTTQEQADAVVAWIGERHPYDVPETLVVPVSRAGSDYLAWVRSSVG
jgi:periplasmic divalent cation tolerance protein